MKVVTFLSVKGGVGKTTLTVNTANELATKIGGSDKVLIIDLDAQAGASVYLLGYNQQQALEKQNQTIHELLDKTINNQDLNISKYIINPYKTNPSSGWSPRLDIIVGDSRIINLEREIISRSAAKGFGWSLILYQLLTKLSQLNYSFIFIDPPATLGALSRMALGASNYFLIPLIPDDFGRVTVGMFTKDFFNQAFYEIALAGRQDRPLCGGIVFNKIKTNTHAKIADEIADEIRGKKLYDKYSIPVYKTKLYDRIAYVKSLEEHKPLYKIGDKKAEEEFQSFFDEFYDYVVRDKAKG
ncbi:ParA family protein [Thermofilum adornatum]|uniref:ParA family protein n=1 Tax=Thermofilum adornatum TaxID=1365176 RepID=UPI00069B6C5B|nr:ParA family protein [Thermofilum adornatum]